MSALGQKQTLKRFNPMSALPPKADIYSQMNHATSALGHEGLRGFQTPMCEE